MIKRNKDLINDYSTHSNIIPTFGNIDFSSFPSTTISFFDVEDDLIIKQRLWWLGNIIFCLLDLYDELSSETKIFNVKKDFYSSMTKLASQNNKILVEIQKNERFKKHEGIVLKNSL
ncbi:hypothetical protein BSK56_21055 [Paenibacillus borealis]|uniref:Uncharacterized protein n=1 Tax=Paenibacillus borealis TaxID=160799 RepID=A0ABX3H3T9_PAEBO|nr:hypothetical protein BSK56_21055 [Paenibacillus borealis]